MEIERNIMKTRTEKAVKEGVLIENLKNMILYDTHFVTSFFVITVCHSGTVTAEYDTHPVVFGARQVSVTFPNHVIMFNKPSEDYNSTTVLVSQELFSKLVMLNMHASRFKYEQSLDFKLSEDQYEDVMKIIEAMRVVSHVEIEGKKERFAHLLDILMSVLNVYRSANCGKTDEKTGANLSSRFYEAVIEHCTKHHDVGFYADLFCLSPKYFSTVIKEETGQAAGHWIRQHVVLRAKMLLRNDFEMSMLDISDALGFVDQTVFSRFFKRETGMTPFEYRQQF